jgi:hypothetical protein
MPLILTTQEAEIRKIVVRGQPRQKVIQTPISIIKLGMMVHTHVPRYW